MAYPFWQHFGRKDKVRHNQNPARTTKYFKKQFCMKPYKRHLIGQHSSKGKEYFELQLDWRDAFTTIVEVIVRIFLSIKTMRTFRLIMLFQLLILSDPKKDLFSVIAYVYKISNSSSLSLVQLL